MELPINIELPIDYDNILEICSKQRTYGYNGVSSKREQFRNRFKLYNDQQKSEDKLSSNMIYTVMQTLLSNYYNDDISVYFGARELGDEEQADNLNILAKSDAEDMEYDIDQYQLQWDRLFYGVGIRFMNGWNKSCKIPYYTLHDPLTWIPDLDAQYTKVGTFKYFGFETQRTKQEMINNPYFFNLDKLSNSTNTDINNNKIQQSQPSNINYAGTGLPHGLYYVYDHFTIINGEKRLFSFANDFKTIIRAQRIKPIEGETETPRGLVLNYYSPERGNPYGVSLPDLLEDKQKAFSLISNLMVIKTKRNSLGGHILYNPAFVGNIAQLASNGIDPKFVAVRGDINNVMKEVVSNPVGQEQFNLGQFIIEQGQYVTGVDNNQIGIQSTGTQTATEVQTNVARSNLRTIMFNKINFWGEKEFWNLWYREYVKNFSDMETKIVRLKNNNISKPIVYKGTDIKLKANPDIEIKSKSDALLENKQKAANLMAITTILMAYPNIPEISKMFLIREILRKNDVDANEVEYYIPPTADEMKAKEGLVLINNGESPTPAVEGEDHMTYILIRKSAFDRIKRNGKWIINPAKEAAIQTRISAMIKEQTNTQQQGGQGAEAANIGTNQIIANATKQQNNALNILGQ